MVMCMHVQINLREEEALLSRPFSEKLFGVRPSGETLEFLKVFLLHQEQETTGRQSSTDTWRILEI